MGPVVKKSFWRVWGPAWEINFGAVGRDGLACRLGRAVDVCHRHTPPRRAVRTICLLAARRGRRALQTGPPGARFCPLVRGRTLCAPTQSVRFCRPCV